MWDVGKKLAILSEPNTGYQFQMNREFFFLSYFVCFSTWTLKTTDCIGRKDIFSKKATILTLKWKINERKTSLFKMFFIISLFSVFHCTSGASPGLKKGWWWWKTLQQTLLLTWFFHRLESFEARFFSTDVLKW